MKKILLLFFIAIAPLIVFCQDCAQNFLGTKTLYQPQQQRYTAPPKGYAPVLINYVGRHGARHLTKDVNTSEAYILLIKADSVHALTKDGVRLKAMVLLLEKVEKTNFKSISDEGKQELKGIAMRMYHNNASFFKQVTANVIVSKEQRAKQSAQAFFEPLVAFKVVQELPTPVDDTVLRFYDFSPVYTTYKKKGEWQQQIAELKTTLHYNELIKKFAARFFNAGFLTAADPIVAAEFAGDIVGFHDILFSLQKEIRYAGISPGELNFAAFFSCSDLKTLNKIDEAEDFYLKGPGNNIYGIQVKIAAPLLVNFMQTTEGFLQTKSPNLQLRFTHAEAISPFAAIMGITSASKAADDVNKISNVWNAAETIPLSANIQWIIYAKQNSGDYLVKFLLNEKEVAIAGMPKTTFPYYHWKDVSKLYNAKLKALKISPGDNMYQYLLKVK